MQLVCYMPHRPIPKRLRWIISGGMSELQRLWNRRINKGCLHPAERYSMCCVQCDIEQCFHNSRLMRVAMRVGLLSRCEF